MKKEIFIIFTCLLISSTAISQRNVIKINLLGSLFVSTALSYEEAVSNKMSYEISLLYVSEKDELNGGENGKSSGIGIEGKLKFYLSKSEIAPRGLYTAPVITFDYFNPWTKGRLRRYTVLKGGVLIGNQWVFGGRNSGLALDINFGVQYTSTTLIEAIGDKPADGILIRAGASLGYAW